MTFKQHFQKLALLLFAGLLFSVTTTFAEDISYNDSWGKQGYSVTSQKSTSVEINFSISNFSLSQGIINGESMDILGLPGVLLPNNEGAPNLPGNGRYLAIPEGAMATLNVVSFRKETFKDIELSPAPRIPLDTEDGPLDFAKDMKIYQKDAFYPANPFQLSEVTQIRGVDAVMLGITPFQYNPITKELIVYRDVQIEVSFEGGTGHFGEDRLRSRYWDPLMNDMFLNHASLPEIDYNQMMGSKTTGCEYLIITPTDAIFQQWADSIKEFRMLQGILTDVVTLDDVGGNTASILESYVNEAYAWDIAPSAILLLGDYGSNASNSITSPIYNSYCVSDNILADVSGNSMPDIVFARMTAQNAAQLEVMITKFLDYERTPPTSADFYDHPITALGFQTERWFQICSESVAGFWENELGKNPVRINKTYQGNPNSDPWSTATNTATVLSVFGPNGLGYIPATPGEVNCTWNGSAQDVVNGINDGAFMLQHRDHGSETGWGEPSFQSSHINSLNNTDLSFIWSINCLTGKYNISGECFAEKFHRYTSGGENSGCLGIVAASEVSYSFVNDTYVWGAYDNQWPDFLPDYGSTPDSRGVLPAFGNAAGKYFLQQSSWPYNVSNKEVTYNLFHMHGDAFSMVYSEIPQDLTITHNPVLFAGVTTFDISANAGAFIALTVNGEIIGTAEGTGAPISINIEGQIPPDQVVVTITLQNYFRYTAVVDVVPAAGPYIVKDEYVINDAAGNNNGMMDYGESNLLSLTVKNVGVEQADNVVVTINTTDEYITITDDTENYGNIAPDATATVVDGFAYDVAEDIPDMHNASFEVSATNGTDTWLSYFSITGHAPVLEYVDFMISDPTGNNNGKFDPGETVDILVNCENEGSSEAFNLIADLLASDTYITINTSEVPYGNLAAGEVYGGVFSVTADEDTPAGHIVDFTFDVAADMGIIGSGMFMVVVGQIPVLILNLESGSSASEMAQALDVTEISYETLSSFPADLNLYSSIFVNLGIYPGHVLTSSEGNLLADFMNNGGSLYMEGGDTWAYDTQTAAHAMFNINGAEDGASDMGTVQGQTGTFTEGMSFNYSGANSYMDHLEPIGDAFMILKNQSPAYGTGVAYDGGTYKTIGTSHEFGGLDDATFPSTKEELMHQYLVFFGLMQGGTLNADFSADETDICIDGDVTFNDLTFGTPTSWSWTFEGGTPETSTEQNPTVTYATVGIYDVTLEVGDGTNTSTISKEDYITVSTAPETPETPAGEAEACTNYGLLYEYSVTNITNAISYEWEISPVEAGTVSGTTNIVSVEWTDNWIGAATISVKAINECGESDFSEDFDVMCSICTGIADNINENNLSIYPNPNTGSFTFELNGFNNEVRVTIYNALGKVVYQSDKLEVSGNYSKTIDLDAEAGVYYMHIEGENVLINKKVIIQK